MPTVLFSQPSPAGVALLAAYVRMWTETLASDDLYVVADPAWTMTRQFWSRCLPWVLGSQEDGPPIHRVQRADGRYVLHAAASLPPRCTIVILRIPRDSATPEADAACRRELQELVKSRGALNVLEITDSFLASAYAPIEGLQSVCLTGTRLLSPCGAPCAETVELERLVSACLYTKDDQAMAFLQPALAMVTKVRGDLPALITSLLNDGIRSIGLGFPVRYVPATWMQEGDALLFPVVLTTDERRQLPGPASTFLEPILHSVLASRPEVDWGITYAEIDGEPGCYRVVVAARYDVHAMRQTLRDRLGDYPMAAAYPFLPPGVTYYGMVHVDARGLRQMLTSVLPAFFPRLDRELRRQGLCAEDGVLARTALSLLEPSAVLGGTPEGELTLRGDRPWVIGGDLSPTHPAVIAAASLLGPTPKGDCIRLFYETRESLHLCGTWHTLKAHEAPRPELTEKIRSFCVAYLDLWKTARLPLPGRLFTYGERPRDWEDLDLLARMADRVKAGAEVDEAFFATLGRLYEGDFSGPGHPHFFSLANLLGRFYRSAIDSRVAVGGYWEPLEGALPPDCLMWSREVHEHVLQAFRADLPRHGCVPGFLRMLLTSDGDFVELSLLSSGPGLERARLQQALRGAVSRAGLKTAAQAVFSYGGTVSYRCRDGWYDLEGEGFGLRPAARPRPTTLSVCLVGLPYLEDALTSNERLVAVGPEEHPDVLLTAGDWEVEAAWSPPVIAVSDEAVALPAIAMAAAEAESFLRHLVGFEIVYRFRALGRVAAPSVASLQPAVSPPLRDACVLVNDDADLLRRWTNDIAAFRLHPASSTAEAWAAYERVRDEVGLVVTDNFMPHENEGVELARRLREDGYDGAIVIATGAPSLVPVSVREHLCLTVVASDVPMGPARVGAWQSHVPTPARMDALRADTAARVRRTLLDRCRYRHLTRLLRQSATGDDPTQALFGADGEAVAAAFGVGRVDLPRVPALMPLYHRLEEVREGAAPEAYVREWAQVLERISPS